MNGHLLQFIKNHEYYSLFIPLQCFSELGYYRTAWEIFFKVILKLVGWFDVRSIREFINFKLVHIMNHDCGFLFVFNLVQNHLWLLNYIMRLTYRLFQLWNHIIICIWFVLHYRNTAATLYLAEFNKLFIITMSTLCL